MLFSVRPTPTPAPAPNLSVRHARRSLLAHYLPAYYYQLTTQPTTTNKQTSLPLPANNPAYHY
jgi:hypothetical protein